MLTLPYRLRYRLAWDHALCRAVLGGYARTLLAFYARTARAHGIQDGQTGTVTVIQRFASGLQLNVHFHTLVLDGVFSEARPGPLTFHPAPPPSDDVAHVLATARARVGQLLARRHLEAADDTAPADGGLAERRYVSLRPGRARRARPASGRCIGRMARWCSCGQCRAGSLPTATPQRPARRVGAGEREELRAFPGDATRIVRRARGYRATLVNGQVLLLDSVPTGRLPGRVLRSSN